VLTRVVGVRLIERVRVRIDSSAASIHASRARTLRQRCEPYERLSDMPIARLRDIAATRELQTKWGCHPGLAIRERRFERPGSSGRGRKLPGSTSFDFGRVSAGCLPRERTLTIIVPLHPRAARSGSSLRLRGPPSVPKTALPFKVLLDDGRRRPYARETR